MTLKTPKEIYEELMKKIEEISRQAEIELERFNYYSGPQR
jgi:predicted nucleic acid-binding protein